VLATGATLAITGLVPAAVYAVTVMSHHPLGTALESTIFEIGDLAPFTIANVPSPPEGSDLRALQAQTVAVAADGSGAILIRYRAGNSLGSGVLNGVEVVPEPGTAALLGAGLALVAALRRR
jgi:hypothetical protein